MITKKKILDNINDLKHTLSLMDRNIKNLMTDTRQRLCKHEKTNVEDQRTTSYDYYGWIRKTTCIECDKVIEERAITDEDHLEYEIEQKQEELKKLRTKETK